MRGLYVKFFAAPDAFQSTDIIVMGVPHHYFLENNAYNFGYKNDIFFHIKNLKL